MSHQSIVGVSTSQDLPEAKHQPKLLVSVRDVAEIEDAIAGGADWIDFKEPRTGSLGAVSFTQACRMVDTIALRKPISAALGELVNWKHASAQQLMRVDGIEVMKMGLAGCASLNVWVDAWKSLFQQAAEHGKQLAAVIYADWSRAEAPDPISVLETAIKMEANYLLIDTWEKRSRSTLNCFPSRELQRIVNLARQSEMQTVLAGNLQLADMPSAVELGTNLVAVRGAACQGLRTDKIDPCAVRAIKMALARALSANQKSDVHLLREFD